MANWKKALNKVCKKKTIFRQVWNANTLKGRHTANFALWKEVHEKTGTDEELLPLYKRHLVALGLVRE